MISSGDQVVVSSPSAAHSHMNGQSGRVLSVKVDKKSRRWVARVGFFGGAGWFDVDELEPKQKSA